MIAENVIDIGSEPVRQQADVVDITYYTDPLCCWSWAMHNDWDKLQQVYAGKLTVRYCMGGLLPSWKTYHDTVNSVTRPSQMGPVWMHARQLSGVEINDKIWMTDPPASSYPACIAVNSAALQSQAFGERYLRLAQEAVMIRGENISKTEVLQALAQSLQQEDEQFDVSEFNNDLINGNGLEAFRKDLNEAQARGIERFPTFIFRYGQQAVMLTGYRPFTALEETMKKLAPGLLV